MLRWFRGLYRRMLELAASERAGSALGVLAFAESMIFPIPPDVMLVPMCMARPKRAWRYALLCSWSSVLGGAAGYALGSFAWQAVGPWFFAHVPGLSPEGFQQMSGLYDSYNFWIVFAAGFTPIPYKLITISAGVFDIAFPTFMLASAVGRSARFFLVAALLRRYGDAARDFIERRFALVAYAFVILLFGGFWLISQL